MAAPPLGTFLGPDVTLPVGDMMFGTVSMVCRRPGRGKFCKYVGAPLWQ